MFNALGCMGCHQVINEPVDPDFDNLPYELFTSLFGYDSEEMTRYELLKNQGPNLLGVGSKADAEWVYNWIKDPSKYYPETKMPDMRLTHEESADITAYLLTLKNSEFDDLDAPYYDDKELNNIARSWLIKSYPEVDALEKLSKMSNADVIDYVGTMTLDPEQDEWMETEVLPELQVDMPGTFDTLTSLASAGVLIS